MVYSLHRRLIPTLAGVVASVGLAGASESRSVPAHGASGGPSRSVLLLIGDDHGLEVGAYGDPLVRTPHLDPLAARGTRFSNAFATVSSCSSSRAVMLTGLHTHQNGQYGLPQAVHNQHTFDWVETLPALLRKAGYRTGIVGRKHMKPDALYPFDVEVAGQCPRIPDRLPRRPGAFCPNCLVPEH